MFNVVLELCPPGGAFEFVVPADSDLGRRFTSVVLKHADDAPVYWDEPDIVVTALVYSQVFPEGQKGASVREVAETLSVSEDVVRDLLADGEIIGWKVRARVIVSTESVRDFLEANEWH